MFGTFLQGVMSPIVGFNLTIFLRYFHPIKGRKIGIFGQDQKTKTTYLLV